MIANFMAEISVYGLAMLIWLGETGCDVHAHVHGQTLYMYGGYTNTYTEKSHLKLSVLVKILQTPQANDVDCGGILFSSDCGSTYPSLKLHLKLEQVTLSLSLYLLFPC